MFAYAFTFLAALAVTFILTPAVKNFAVQIGAVDKPDARKVHHGLVPRLGGLAIYAGFMVSVILTVGCTKQESFRPFRHSRHLLTYCFKTDTWICFYNYLIMNMRHNAAVS